MANRERSTVVGVFTDRDQAERAAEELHAAGFQSDQIGILRRSDVTPTPAQDTKAPEGATTGAISGGVIGGLLGAAAVGLIPGIGPVLAAGALAAVATGVVAGATAGTIVGALAGMGIPEEEAQFYEGELKGGRTLVTVQANGRGDEAARILRRFGAYDWTNRATATPGVGGDPRTMELRGERIVADKQWRESGEIVIRRVVEEVPGTLELDAVREEVDVERVPVGEVVTERREPWMEGDALVVPVYEEQLVVSRRLILREQLRVRRVRVAERKVFEDTLRQERILIEDPDQTGQVREHYGEPEAEHP